MHVPRVVTFELGSAVRKQGGCFAPLGPDELISILAEVADLRIGSIRFSLENVQAMDSLGRAAEYARRRGAETTIALAGVRPTDDVLRDLYGVQPAAIAVPLHVHETSIHDAIPGRTRAWDELAGLAAAIRRSGASLEVETRVIRRCADTLAAIAEAVEELGAMRWRVDFSGVRLGGFPAAAAAEAILDAAARDALHVTVQSLSSLRHALVRRLQRDRAVPDLRRLHTLDATDALRISRDGDVYFAGATQPAGNVRHDALDAIVAHLWSAPASDGVAPCDVRHTSV